MRIKPIALQVFVLTLLLVTRISSADSINPPFSAICEPIETHAFRSSTDILGNPMKDSWTNSEKFFESKWNFLYTSGSAILIFDKKVPIFIQHPDVIIAADFGSAPSAAAVWTYAIHLGYRKIVASQVNAHGFSGTKMKGVKTRSVNFDCVFQIHKPIDD